jgi:hypothetical protein
MESATRKELQQELRRMIERYGLSDVAQIFAEVASEAAQAQTEPSEIPASTPDENTRCSFCGGGHEDIEGLIAGPGVFICFKCIDLCHHAKVKQRRKK